MPGIEPGAIELSPNTLRPPWFWWITDQLRPIEIGVTNRTRTGTNAFTGRDAADYIMITIQTGAPGRTRTDEYGFTKPALWLLRHRG